jgi:23S rRNA pseudouridine1911/1915/1917 synthase
MAEESLHHIEDAELFIHHEYHVDLGQDALRIDKFLMTRIEKISRNKIQNAAKAGAIRVNGKPVKSNYKIKPDDHITVVMDSEKKKLEIIPEDIPVEIVYEDDTVIVVNKKPGMVVHPGHGNYSGTLVNAVSYHIENLPEGSGIEGNKRPGLVHRIDKFTSGLLVMAKTDYALAHLGKQFFDHSVERRYQAIVWGNVNEDEGTIVGHIARDSRDRKKFRVYPEEDGVGKHAVTHYKVLERFGYMTLVECKLETGRTHQIRVHMKHIGHILFQDHDYGGNAILKGSAQARYQQFIKNCFVQLSRQALHAKTLGFIHPETGEKMHFNSDLPNDMAEVIEKMRGYIEPMKHRLEDL